MEARSRILRHRCWRRHRSRRHRKGRRPCMRPIRREICEIRDCAGAGGTISVVVLCEAVRNCENVCDDTGTLVVPVSFSQCGKARVRPSRGVPFVWGHAPAPLLSCWRSYHRCFLASWSSSYPATPAESGSDPAGEAARRLVGESYWSSVSASGMVVKSSAAWQRHDENTPTQDKRLNAAPGPEP